MTIEADIKAVEVAAENEADKIETAAVEETRKAEAAVETVVEKIKEVAKRVRVDLEAAEKLVLRDAETEFLRAQIAIRDLQSQIKDASTKAEVATKKYAEQIEVLVKKYAIDKTEMIFDNMDNAFKAVKKAL